MALLTPFNNRAGAATSALRAQTVRSAAERCKVFGLAPNQAPDLHRLLPRELQELQQRNARLHAQALPVMEMLYEQLTHAQSIVLLTDASGVVLHALGDAGFLQRAEQIALAPGALWAEANKGTNAVGTALMTEQPTCIFGQEHYLRALQFLTCAAAPLFDHKGALLGVINVSSDRRAYHPHTQALASLAARLIETQWFNDKFSHHLRLHLHPHSSALGTLHEGVLALDDAGLVLGANRRAIELLGDSAHHLRRSGVQSLFDTELSGLIDQARQAPEQSLRLAFIRPNQPGSPGEPNRGLPLHARLSLGTAQMQRQVPQHLQLSAQSQHAAIDPLEREGNEANGSDDVSSVAAEPAESADTVPAPMAARLVSGLAARCEPAQSCSNSHLDGDLDRSADLPPQTAPTLRQAEHLAIQAAVEHCGGNLALAARNLGIGRSTLYRKLKSVAGTAMRVPAPPRADQV